MKFIAILFALLIATSMAKVTKINKKVGRISTTEAVAFQFQYLGNCNQWNAIQGTVRVSTLYSPNGCLPISDAAPFNAIDDLNAHVLCTDTARNRAQIDFVEIFQVSEDNIYNGTYAISFVPNRPFRTIPGFSYIRRPTCTNQKDICSTNFYINSCSENFAVVKKGFVVSNDEVFIVPSSSVPAGCGNATNSCCSYLNVPTFCPRTASNAQLELNWEQHHDHYEDHHDNHHDDHHDDHDDDHYGNHRPPQTPRPQRPQQYHKDDSASKNLQFEEDDDKKALLLI